MRQLILLISTLMTLPCLAAPEDHGRLLDEDSSSGSGFGILIVLIIIGAIVYNAFKKDGKEERGCIAVIIAFVLLFIIVYAINH